MLGSGIYTNEVAAGRGVSGRGGGDLWELGDGARVVLCCAGSAMGSSLVELSWSDAGGALRPLIASGGTRTARRRRFSAELMMLNRSA